MTNQTDNSVTFQLTPHDLDSSQRRLWDAEFQLAYTVKLAETELKTELEVYNPGTEPFECNTLLHTYLRVDVRCSLAYITDFRTSLMLPLVVFVTSITKTKSPEQ